MKNRRQLYLPTVLRNRWRATLPLAACSHGRPRGRSVYDPRARVHYSHLRVSTGRRGAPCDVPAPLSAHYSVAHHSSSPNEDAQREESAPRPLRLASVREHLHDEEACSTGGCCRRCKGRRQLSGHRPRPWRLVKRGVTSRVLGVGDFLSNVWAQAMVLRHTNNTPAF